MYPRTAEPLERRFLFATFVVTSAADGGPGSLREAILAANASEGPDAIHFNLPAPAAISPVQPLPAVTGPTTIDGTTQPGGDNADGPRVRLIPAYAAQHDTLRLVDASGSVVRGLVVAGSYSAIHVLGGSNVVIEGNHVGAVGAPFPTGMGVLLEGATDCRVGGTSPGQRNVISGNHGGGVWIRPAASVPRTETAPANHRVLGNYIGTDAAGGAVEDWNYWGVAVDRTTGTVIGGAEPGARNVMAGHNTAVFVTDGQVTVRGNYIGVDASGRKGLGNKYGVWVEPRGTSSPRGRTWVARSPPSRPQDRSRRRPCGAAARRMRSSTRSKRPSCFSGARRSIMRGRDKGSGVTFMIGQLRPEASRGGRSWGLAARSHGMLTSPVLRLPAARETRRTETCTSSTEQRWTRPKTR